MSSLLEHFKGGDRRSVRGVAEVLAHVLAEPSLFPILLNGISDVDPLVRMRAADAAEKVSVQRPDLLRPYKSRIIRLAAHAEQQEVRWHMAQMLSRLTLNGKERQRVLEVLDVYLKDRSSIVRTFSMDALASIAVQDPRMRAQIVRRLTRLTARGSPAMRSRGRKLLDRLKG
jgi:hypothetical protein